MSNTADSPDTTPRRRTFTGEYKARILDECDRAAEPGTIGAILRREGLYSSHLADWRRRRAEGGEQGLAPVKAGRPAKAAALRQAEEEAERLARENARLREKLRRADLIIEAQKKLSEVLQALQEPSEKNE